MLTMFTLFRLFANQSTGSQKFSMICSTQYDQAFTDLYWLMHQNDRGRRPEGVVSTEYMFYCELNCLMLNGWNCCIFWYENWVHKLIYKNVLKKIDIVCNCIITFATLFNCKWKLGPEIHTLCFWPTN